MKKNLYRLLTVLFILISSVSFSQITITQNPPGPDYCQLLGWVTLSIPSPDPNGSYYWSYLADADFPGTPGRSLGTGSSITLYLPDYHQSCMFIMAHGPGLGISSTVSLCGSMLGSPDIPVYFDSLGCGSVTVPTAYLSYVNNQPGRWSGWYKNGTLVSTNQQTLYQSGPGVYQYKLRLSCGDTLYSRVVTSALNIINPIVSPSGPATICMGDTITLSTQIPFATYQWYRQDNTGAQNAIAGATSSIYKATLPGLYFVRTNGSASPNINCSSYSNFVTVNVQNAAFITAASAPYCSGDSVKLTCTASPTYIWKKNGVVIAGANSQSIYVKNTGDYQVITFGLACDTSKIQHIQFNPKPTISINQTSPQSLCTGSGLDLTTTATNTVAYQWTLNNVNISGATSVTYFALKNGNYRCIATSTTGCIKNSPVFNITNSISNTLPLKTITIKPTFANGKDSYITSLGFTNTNYGSVTTMKISNRFGSSSLFDRGIIQFDLSTIPEGATINSASAKFFVDTTINWSNSQQALVFQRALSAWKEDSITWNNKPSLTVLQQVTVPKDSVLKGSFFKAVIKDMVIYWKNKPLENNGMFVSMKNETTNQYGLVRLASSEYLTTTALPSLTVGYTYANIIANGSLTFCAGDSVTLTSNSGPYTYTWYRDNILIAGATGSSYKAKSAGNYYVVITNATGCTAKSVRLTVSVPCRMGNYESEISISPNPSQDAFKIESENGEALEHVQLFDMTGKLIREYPTLESRTVIGEELNSGVYLLQTGNNIHQRKKFVKL